MEKDSGQLIIRNCVMHGWHRWTAIMSEQLQIAWTMADSGSFESTVRLMLRFLMQNKIRLHRSSMSSRMKQEVILQGWITMGKNMLSFRWMKLFMWKWLHVKKTASITASMNTVLWPVSIHETSIISILRWKKEKWWKAFSQHTIKRSWRRILRKVPMRTTDFMMQMETQ